MGQSTPVTITLYDKNDEPETFSRIIVPWGILKRSLVLAKEYHLDEKNNLDELEPEAFDAIAGLVCEIFDNQFSVADLDKRADISDVLSIFREITLRAEQAIAREGNPTPPARKRR